MATVLDDAESLDDLGDVIMVVRETELKGIYGQSSGTLKDARLGYDVDGLSYHELPEDVRPTYNVYIRLTNHGEDDGYRVTNVGLDGDNPWLWNNTGVSESMKEVGATSMACTTSIRFGNKSLTTLDEVRDDVDRIVHACSDACLHDVTTAVGYLKPSTKLVRARQLVDKGHIDPVNPLW